MAGRLGGNNGGGGSGNSGSGFPGSGGVAGAGADLETAVGTVMGGGNNGRNYDRWGGGAPAPSFCLCSQDLFHSALFYL